MGDEMKFVWPIYKNKWLDGIYLRLEDYSCTRNYDPHNLPKNDHPIEKITHYFWLKSHRETSSSKEINDNNIEMMLNTLANLSDDKQCKNLDYYLNKDIDTFCPVQNFYQLPTFKHYLWVNDENLYPETVTKFQAIDVEVKNIKSISSDYKYINEINEYIDKGYYGSMVDILKYEAVKYHGGVSLDLNFRVITENLRDFFNSYSYISMARGIGGVSSYENYFIAAHKGHPLLNKMSDMVTQIFEDYNNLRLFCIVDNRNCTDDDLVNLTFGHVLAMVYRSMESEEGVNEIFQAGICEVSSILTIGSDSFSESKSWEHTDFI